MDDVFDFGDEPKQDVKNAQETYNEVFGNEQERKEKAESDLTAQFQELIETKARYEAMKKQTDKLKKLLDQQKENVVHELKKRQLKTVHSDIGFRFTVVEKREFKSDPDQKVKYCMENGYEELLDVYYGKWNSHWKHLAEEGEEIPAFVVENKKETLSIAKKK